MLTADDANEWMGFVDIIHSPYPPSAVNDQGSWVHDRVPEQKVSFPTQDMLDSMCGPSETSTCHEHH